MVVLTPGKIIKTFMTRNGKKALIRYPRWEDLSQMILFINKLSFEDTYITFSGETITHEGETYYLSEMFKSMEIRNGMYLTCFVEDAMVGSCTVMRDLQSRKRSYHIGTFGITIAKDFREIGIGEELSKATMEEAKKHIPGLKTFVLNVFGPNIRAQKLYKKLGFTEYARLPQGVFYKGQYVEEIKMFLPTLSV